MPHRISAGPAAAALEMWEFFQHPAGKFPPPALRAHRRRLYFAFRRSGPQLAIAREDGSGSGISDDVAARATEPFFTTKAEGKGTRLELAIANEIVKHHCGLLELTARVGTRGTEARVGLALAGKDADA